MSNDDFNFDNGDQQQQQLQQLQHQQEVAELEQLTKDIAGKTGKQPFEVEGYLHETARKNPDIRKTFEERHTNPQAFEKLKADVTSELAPKKQYGSMSEAEFQAELRKVGN